MKFNYIGGIKTQWLLVILGKKASTSIVHSKTGKIERIKKVTNKIKIQTRQIIIIKI